MHLYPQRANKNYRSLHYSMSTTKFTERNPFFKEKTESLPGTVICAAFFSRIASRNCNKGLEEMLLDGVANVSAIVDFSFGSLDHLAGSKNIYI